MSLLQSRSVKPKSLSEQQHHDQECCPTAPTQTLDVACMAQFPLSMLLLLHQHPRQSWAFAPISAQWSPVLWYIQKMGTGTHLKYISTEQKPSEVCRILQGSIMKLTGQAKLAIRYDSLCLMQVKVIEAHLRLRIYGSCKLRDTALCWLCLLRCSQMVTTCISFRDFSKNCRDFHLYLFQVESMS